MLKKAPHCCGRRVTPPTETKRLPARRLVLQELQAVLEQQMQAADALDSKLKDLLGTTSLILTLITTLQVATGISAAAPWYWGLLAFVLMLYAGLLWVVLQGLQPQGYEMPIPTTWEKIKEHYFGLAEEQALELLIVTYLACREKNELRLKDKGARVRGASALLATIVIVLIVAALLQLLSNVSGPLLNTFTSPLLTP